MHLKGGGKYQAQGHMEVDRAYLRYYVKGECGMINALWEGY